MHTMPSNSKKNTKGFALLIALVTASIVLALGLSILNITLRDFLLSGAGQESSAAFIAADTGMECALYWSESLSGGQFTTPGPNAIRCMGSNFSVTNTLGSPTSFEVDWGTVAEPLCSKVEVTRYTLAVPDTAPGAVSCPVGTCMKIISRGYNRGCSDLTLPRTVERALRAYYYGP